MIASAALIIIYVAVNIAHLRLYRETGARPFLIWASLLSSVVFLVVLVYYQLAKSAITLILLAAIIILCFVTEWVYRNYSGRSLKKRRL
jgi:L-asparagine transporter-like permease